LTYLKELLTRALVQYSSLSTGFKALHLRFSCNGDQLRVVSICLGLLFRRYLGQLVGNPGIHNTLDNSLQFVSRGMMMPPPASAVGRGPTSRGTCRTWLWGGRPLDEGEGHHGLVLHGRPASCGVQAGEALDSSHIHGHPAPKGPV